MSMDDLVPQSNLSARRSQAIPVLLNGTTIQVEATVQGEEDVLAGMPSFDTVTKAIEEIARAIDGTLAKVKPSKASVELGVDIALESGILTALIVKGTGNASLKITLEWGT
jgi:hypothetical protein